MSKLFSEPQAQVTGSVCGKAIRTESASFRCSVLLGVVLGSVLLSSSPSHAVVPFASDLAVTVAHYNRAGSWLATGGAPSPSAEAMTDLKAAGFVNIVDLRRAQEGVAEARAAAEAAGLHYINIPLGRERPEAAVLARFNAWVIEHRGQDTLLHCASGNRAGTLWALHLIDQGVPVNQAIEQGLAAGMAPNRVSWLEEHAQSHVRPVQ